MTSPMRTPAVVDALMDGLPYPHRHWCDRPGCGCSDHVSAVVSREEWHAWLMRQNHAVCERCDRAVRIVARDGNTYLACETCDVFWA